MTGIGQKFLARSICRPFEIMQALQTDLCVGRKFRRSVFDFRVVEIKPGGDPRRDSIAVGVRSSNFTFWRPKWAHHRPRVGGALTGS